MKSGRSNRWLNWGESVVKRESCSTRMPCNRSEKSHSATSRNSRLTWSRSVLISSTGQKERERFIFGLHYYLIRFFLAEVTKMSGGQEQRISRGSWVLLKPWSDLLRTRFSQQLCSSL